MTAESLWELFARTGLPEAYSLYHRTVSGAVRDPFGLPYRDTLVMGQYKGPQLTDETSGT